MGQIPRNLQGVLWSTPINELDLDKHKSYIIHQILMYGDFSHIQWLFNTYSKKQIQKVFLEKPQKIYTKPALNYISKYILELKNHPSFNKYVSTIYKNS